MYYGQRTFQDLKSMNPLVGKTFYEEGEGRKGKAATNVTLA